MVLRTLNVEEEMKFIVKNPDVASCEAKPYILRFYQPLLPVIRALPEYDPKSIEDIQISNWQKDHLKDCGRTFWIVSYYPVSVLRYILETIDGLTHWAFCVHDSDCEADGSLKKVHTHLLLYFDERVSGSYVASVFHTLEVKVISRSDIRSEWNYLIHDSEACRRQKKHIYDKADRISDDEAYWLSRCVSVSDEGFFVDMYKDFLRRDISGVEFLKKYGYEAIRSIRALKELRNRFCDDIHGEKYWERRKRIEAIIKQPDIDLVAFRSMFGQESFVGGDDDEI